MWFGTSPLPSALNSRPDSSLCGSVDSLVVLIGSNDKDRSEKVHPLRELSLFIDFEVMLGGAGEVMEKQEAAVVHG